MHRVRDFGNKKPPSPRFPGGEQRVPGYSEEYPGTRELAGTRAPTTGKFESTSRTRDEYWQRMFVLAST